MAFYRETPAHRQDIDPLEFEQSAEYGAAPRKEDSPGVALTPEHLAGYAFASPHPEQEAWRTRICAAFGTRRMSTATTFLEQLISLCSVSYDGRDARWKPSERELNFTVELIASIRPRNPMEAGLAAQMVAVHLMQMRISAQVLGDKHIEARDASVAGKLARTFAIQMETLARMRGKRSVRQNITVRHEKHVHHHQHQHVEFPAANSPDAAWGCSPSDTSPLLKSGDQNDGGNRIRRSLPAAASTLPGEDQIRAVVPIASRARKARV